MFYICSLLATNQITCTIPVDHELENSEVWNLNKLTPFATDDFSD